MKSGNISLGQISKLLDDKLGPVKEELKDIKQTQVAHSRSLADIENRIIPLAETVGAVVVDHSKRLGGIEGRIDDLEPRVSALESAA